MKRWTLLPILAVGLMIAATARGKEQASSWKPVNGKWEGGSTAAILTSVAGWPGKDEVVASTRGNGLWSSYRSRAPPGAAWASPARAASTPEKAVQIVFDPKDPNTMWASGIVPTPAFGKRPTAAKTFTHLSNNNHRRWLRGRFPTGPRRRKTQLMGLHEQEHRLHESTDGGATWLKIGDKIPDGTAFTTNPIILDAKTCIINSSGNKKGEDVGNLFAPWMAARRGRTSPGEGRQRQSHNHLEGHNLLVRALGSTDHQERRLRKNLAADQRRGARQCDRGSSRPAGKALAATVQRNCTWSKDDYAT